ncbi:MAG: hypothetical protein CL521_01720 [Actinobacteria bacterium]|nr:hypothetical protein [Actinomycetota bacterium]
MTNSSKKRAFFIIFLIVATELIGFGLIIPVLPQLAYQFESSYWLIGLLMSAYSMAQFFAAPLLGRLSDKYGRKPLLIASKIGTVIAYVILANASTYTMFLISRLLDGFTGGNIAIARAYISDITTPENRPKGMAMIGLAFGTGFILGPALGGILYRPGTGHMMAALVAGSFALLALILTIILLEEPKTHRQVSSKKGFFSSYNYLSVPGILLVCGTYFIYMCCFSGFETSFSMFTYSIFQFTEQQNSYLFFYAGICSLFVQGFLVRKAPKNLPLMTMVGLLAVATAFVGMAMAPIWQWLLIWMMFFAIGIGLVNTYLPSILTLETNEDNKGEILGLYEGIGSLSRIIGPLLAYTLVVPIPRVGYGCYAVVLVGTAIGLFYLLNRAKTVSST